jgi:hypothetical protein
MKRAMSGVVIAASLSLACGGQTKAKSEPAAATVKSSEPQTDTLKAVPTTSATAKPKSDSTPAKQSDVPLRDSAFGPKFVLDSTGKSTPIKKRP